MDIFRQVVYCVVVKYYETVARMWNVFLGMKARCYNPTAQSYGAYGGRGIEICDRWLEIDGFENFVKDMGIRPSPAHSLDRIDVNGNYGPENCKWATSREQAVNRRNNNSIPGVYHRTINAKGRRPWGAKLYQNGKVVFQKEFHTYEEAVAARLEAEKLFPDITGISWRPEREK